MAIVRRRGTIQSQKFARKQRKKTIFVAVLFFIAVLSIFTGIFFFFRAEFVQIKSISVSGPVGMNGGVLSIVPADAVQTDIENDLTGGWLFGFISKNTLFFYPKNAIRAQLMQEYPAIESINFGSSGDFLGFGGNIALKILIAERSPYALACSEGFVVSANPSTSNQSCFYMDSNGFVYAPAAQFSPGVYINYETTPQSGLPPAVPGKPIADPDSFATAKQIVSSVSGMGLKVTGDIIGTDPWGSTDTLIVDNGTTNAANSADSSISPSTDAALATSTDNTDTTEIYFNQNEALDTELRYFSEFWKQQATGTTTIYQYIDMRYGKDIVYKAYDSATSSKK